MLRHAFISLLVFSASAAGRTGSLGKSTYAMSHPWAWKTWMEKYLPTAENIAVQNDTSTCVEWVKLCIDDGHMTSCSGPQGNVQLHAVGAYKRDSGKYSMEELEQFFTQAMGEMKKYDPFMESHAGFYTADLDAYVTAFKSGGVPYLSTTFTDPSTKETYQSVILQTPGSLGEAAKSMVVLEIMGKSSLLNSTDISHPVMRASPASISTAQKYLATSSSTSSKPVLSLLHVSFASSNVTRDAEFFESVLAGSKVYAETGSDGTKVYAGKMFSTDTAEVMYVQSPAQTQGPMTIAAWESYQTSLHSKCVGTGSGFDRLADNHLGHSMGSVSVDAYVSRVKAAGIPYRFYGGGESGTSLFYSYGPNGWGLQLSGQCSSCAQGGGYNMCTQGITGHCSSDLPSE